MPKKDEVGKREEKRINRIKERRALAAMLAADIEQAYNTTQNTTRIWLEIAKDELEHTGR